MVPAAQLRAVVARRRSPMVLALSLVSLGLAVVGANVAFLDRALTPTRASR